MLYQLAQELHASSKDLMDWFHSNSVFIRTASQPLTAEQAQMARSQFPRRRQDANNPFASSQRMARPASGPRPNFDAATRPRPQPRRNIPQRLRWYQGEVSDMTRLMLDRKVLPERDWRDHGKRLMNYEVERAKQHADEWAQLWFTPKEVAAWLDLHPHIRPQVAADLQRHGLSPEDAVTRIWYGHVRSDRPTLAERVGCGDITPKQARAELRGVAGRTA